MLTDADIKRLVSEADVTLEVEMDDMDPRGNVCATGDDDADRNAEADVIARLNAGDVWAWAVVTVRAMVEVDSDEVEGLATLGGCNFEDEAEFRACHFADMKAEALEDLAKTLRRRQAAERERARGPLLESTLECAATTIQGLLETALRVDPQEWYAAQKLADVMGPCDAAVEMLRAIAQLLPHSFGKCEECNRVPALRLDDGTLRCAMRHTHTPLG